MRVIKPLLIGLSLLGLACSGAYANDAKQKSDTQAKAASASSGGSSGAATGASARYDFDKADKNKDGRLSRSEFNDMIKGSSTSSARSESKTPSK